MNEPRTPTMPRRPTRQWPVGLRVRFRPDADLQPQFGTLRGSRALILSELKLLPPTATNPDWSWRQEILSFAAGCRLGWARPDQLELPDDHREVEPNYLAQRNLQL